MRVLISRDQPQKLIDACKARYDTTLRQAETPLSESEAKEALASYDAVICTLGDGFRGAAFDGPVRCRILANVGVGYNHIDTALAARAGVTVSNTPGAVTDATADLAILLMLMACRRASEGESLLRSGQWGGWAPTQLLGQHVTGKTVGIVGMGRIGQAVARRAHFGFEMPVAYVNRSPKTLPFEAEQLPSLTDLAARADVLVVTVPGGAETRHLIDVEVFAAMRQSAVFVNVARGDVVDETALIDALQTGQIAAAGLDVYEHEPEVPEALRALPNTALLPHMGTATLEVRERMGLMALDNVIAVAEGRPAPNAV